LYGIANPQVADASILNTQSRRADNGGSLVFQVERRVTSKVCYEVTNKAKKLDGFFGTDLKKMGCGDEKFIELDQDRAQWRAFVRGSRRISTFQSDMTTRNDGVSKSFRTESITNHQQQILVEKRHKGPVKLTTPTDKIALQLHVVAESCTVCNSHSRRPVRKLLDTPSYLNITPTKSQCYVGRNPSQSRP